MDAGAEQGGSLLYTGKVPKMGTGRTVHLTITAAMVFLGVGIPTAAAASPTVFTVGATTTVEAEDFQSTADGYRDTTAKNLGGAYRSTAVDIASGGSGYYVGWTVGGEWLNYGLEVQEAGQYEAVVRLASNQDSVRSFRIEIDGVSASGNVGHSGDGWGSWKETTVPLGAISAGPHDMRLVFEDGKLDVDRIVLRRLVESTSPVVPAAPSAVSGYPGRPAAGDVHWGAFVHTGSSLLANPASRYGRNPEVLRSYFSWSRRASGLPQTAKADVAAGRLPWVSVKPPSWSAMASGRHDGEIDQMLRALDAVPGPVWLTVHHEPEGGKGKNYTDDPAGPAAHLAMNKRVRERMKALKTDNIALGPILMEWTFNPKSGRDPNAYWASGVYDFLGIDTYSDGGTFIDTSWGTVRKWAQGRNVDVAVGEWGISGNGTSAANVMREFYNSAVSSGTDGKGARVVALSVFDSVPKGWSLTGAQLTEFKRILGLQ